MTATRDAVLGALRDGLGERARAFEDRSERRVFLENGEVPVP